MHNVAEGYSLLIPQSTKYILNSKHKAISIIFRSTVMAKLEWTPEKFTIYHQKILLHPIVYNNGVDKSMDLKKCRLHLHESAFTLIPQQLFCTKAINIRRSSKKHDFEISMPNVGCVAP